MEFAAKTMFPKEAVMVEPVVSDGVETVMPPAAEVFTAPAKLAEVPAEALKVDAVMAWVVKVVPAVGFKLEAVMACVLREVAVVMEVAPVVTTAPPTVAEEELFSVNPPA